ncbi:MAG: SMC-Scp complex subunit ScpB [Candidatus Sigynarchaeota archaeon]
MSDEERKPIEGQPEQMEPAIPDGKKPPSDKKVQAGGAPTGAALLAGTAIESGATTDEIPITPASGVPVGEAQAHMAPAPVGSVEQQLAEGSMPNDIDDDEVLDEIKPQAPGKPQKPSPEQYKKDFSKNQIEAVLFVSGQAVSAEEISVKLNIGKKLVEELLDKLAMEYLERSTALEIAKVADKYILQLKPEFTSSVKSFATGGLIREAVMRTLTIIAAKQPILQSDLSKIRSAAGEHLKELTEMGLVKAVPKGRSKELTTTDKFADMFGLSRDVNQMKEQIKIYLTAATKEDGE